MKKVSPFALVVLLSTTTSAQINTLVIPPSIVVARDTILKNQLIASLQGFLSQKEKPNQENTFVLKEDLLEASVLLDEMKEISKHVKLKNDQFYKAYLTGSARINDSTFFIQLAYMGITDTLPLLRASFSLIAQKRGNGFYFKSPLKQNTTNWKTEKIKNTIIHYKIDYNKTQANKYFNRIEAYDKKLSAPVQTMELYCADNFHEALQLIGVDYKSDYNARALGSLSGSENGMHLIVDGFMTSDFKDVDPHDLWHSRLHIVLSTSIINKPVDEGTAYLYGGSWGFTWKEILDKFKNFAAANPNADWLLWYNENKNFDEKAKYPLNVDFVINALIAQKIEKEKGFPAVMELLSCGKQEKGNENYFKALEKITGITKADFNTKVWELIKTKE